MPTHAHIMVLGWLMSAVFAFFYHLVPAARTSRLAVVHFWLSAVSSIGLLVGAVLSLLSAATCRRADAYAATCSMAFFACDAAVRLHRAPALVARAEASRRSLSGRSTTDENFSLIRRRC